MDSRERVLLSLSHEAPDRIPRDFWASQGFVAKLRSATGLTLDGFLDANDVDCRYIAGPVYVGPPLGERDIWGVPRVAVGVSAGGGEERYEEVAAPPLAGARSAEEVANYGHWPSADWFDYSAIGRQCDEVLSMGRAVLFMGDRLNRVAQLKPAMYLRGVSQILEDMLCAPEVAHAIIGGIRRFYDAYLERILDAAGGRIDIVVTGDDFGSQHGPLVSPFLWDKFLRDGFRRYLAMIRDAGARTMHHTCGSVAALIPRMIDAGLDVLQSLQPEAKDMNAARLKEDFGDRICFHGGISIQQTMPFGTPAEVREAVRRLATGAGASGGLIFCTSHNVQADTPMENVRALMSAYEEFGRLC